MKVMAAAQGHASDGVLDIALGDGRADLAVARAESLLAERRSRPADMRGALRHALVTATGAPLRATGTIRAALALGEAVERHGASFPPGREPAYHGRHHQAEAVLAMGWLAGAARRLGLIDRAQAERAVTAMAAHDLLHDGSVPRDRGVLERRSAAAAADIAAGAGMAADAIAELQRIVIATTWPWMPSEAPDLPCLLAREADLFGSCLPELGPRLGRLLAIELAAAGQDDAHLVAGHAARIALLRAMPPPSAAADALGLAGTRAAQVAAYGAVARRLGLVPATPEAGAAALDAMDPGDAEALLARAGAGG